MKKRVAAYALSEVRTIKEAAEIAGVSERTLYRWMSEDDGFRWELERVENIANAVANSKLNFLQEKVVNKIVEFMEGEDTPHSIRFQACKLILERGKRDRIAREDGLRKWNGRSGGLVNPHFQDLESQSLIEQIKLMKTERKHLEAWLEKNSRNGDNEEQS